MNRFLLILFSLFIFCFPANAKKNKKKVKSINNPKVKATYTDPKQCDIVWDNFFFESQGSFLRSCDTEESYNSRNFGNFLTFGTKKSEKVLFFPFSIKEGIYVFHNGGLWKKEVTATYHSLSKSFGTYFVPKRFKNVFQWRNASMIISLIGISSSDYYLVFSHQDKTEEVIQQIATKNGDQYVME